MAGGRPKNQTTTSPLMISTTPIVRALLEVIVTDGTYGKNAAEAADRLLGEKLRELKTQGDSLADRLNQAHRALLEKADSEGS